MERVFVAILTTLFCTILNVKGQENETNWGIKAGANHSSLWDRVEINGRPGIDYQFNTGFYLGGLANFSLSEKWELQPEVLLSQRNIGIEIDGFIDPEADSNLYTATRTETLIDLPVMLRFKMSRLFIETGPQFGFLINQKEEVKENPYGDQEVSLDNYDTFDAGLAAGIGYSFFSKITLNFRYFQGLIKRDESVNSLAFNLGMEYLF
ncbi:porin family protein [Salinimicrobium soli]|uniref:porin family protein n=1 Tax=Salinimicrobium soli TaxID=1254399 RepID=UPI003AAD4BC7